MNIAFCINRLALIGLGPTVSSLIRNCSDSSKLTIWFLGADLNNSDKDNIQTLLKSEDFKGNSQFIDFDPVAHFGEFRSLHGDWTTYGRLLLPELLINEDTVLYLDADLIIEIDILELSSFDFQGKGLAAVFGTKLQYALDNKFLNKKLGFSLDADYFNAGVTFFNLTMWRSNEIKNKCLSIANQFPSELISHDQTLLNAIFHNSYKKLPPYFNSIWYADKEKPTISSSMILHYVGSPKPWDIGGVFIHNGYFVWKSYLTPSWAKDYAQTRISDFVRAWNIRKSYLRILKKRYLK